MNLDSIFDYVRAELPQLSADGTWGGSIFVAGNRLGRAVQTGTPVEESRKELLRAIVWTTKAVLELDGK